MKYIQLTNSDSAAMVDDDCYPFLQEYKWRLCGGGYVSTKFYLTGDRIGFLHRIIMDAPSDMVVDHIDGNPLNNQRSNLRICTRQQNQWNKKGLSKNNTSGYTGVYLNRRTGKWYTQLAFNQKNKTLKSGFSSAEEASAFRKEQAFLHRGEYAL